MQGDGRGFAFLLPRSLWELFRHTPPSALLDYKAPTNVEMLLRKEENLSLDDEGAEWSQRADSLNTFIDKRTTLRKTKLNRYPCISCYYQIYSLLSRHD
jgi:hypothetical protein